MPARTRTALTIIVAALAVALAFPGGAGAARYGSRTLKRGTHGRDVKQLQRYLTKAGHRARRDGDFGPRTRRALRATERELELHADGVASRREQRAIRRSVSSTGTGGAGYAPPPTEEVVPGAKGQVGSDGFAVPPASAP